MLWLEVLVFVKDSDVHFKLDQQGLLWNDEAWW